MKRCDQLNCDTLIIQYKAAIRKVQRMKDLVTDVDGQRNWGFKEVRWYYSHTLNQNRMPLTIDTDSRIKIPVP